MQIRKSNLKYIKCQGGGLHSGELMNLVCVDERCHYRGLVCPICRIESHEDHYILPIKVFLDEISSTFLQREGSGEANTVGEYLQSLERSRKELLGTIRREVTEVAMLFKELEMKVEEYYLSLRRNVLIQSSINTKLPNLVDVLLAENSSSDLDVQQEFKKYCELLRYKDSRLVFSDKSKKLVQLFEGLPGRMEAKVGESLDLFKKELRGQQELLSVQKIAEQITKEPIGYRFSAKEKSENIELDKACLQARGIDKGFVFIDGKLSNGQKLVFKLVRQECDEIIVGIGDRNKFEAYHYNNNEQKTSLQLFATSNGEAQVVTKEEESDKDSDSLSIARVFSFEQAGTRVQIVYNPAEEKIQFTHLGTQQTFSLKLKESLLASDKWNLFFGISSKDIIQLQPPQ